MYYPIHKKMSNDAHHFFYDYPQSPNSVFTFFYIQATYQVYADNYTEISGYGMDFEWFYFYTLLWIL